MYIHSYIHALRWFAVARSWCSTIRLTRWSAVFLRCQYRLDCHTRKPSTPRRVSELLYHFYCSVYIPVAWRCNGFWYISTGQVIETSIVLGNVEKCDKRGEFQHKILVCDLEFLWLGLLKWAKNFGWVKFGKSAPYKGASYPFLNMGMQSV